MAKVSAFLTVTAGAQTLRRAIDIIDATHDDGVLPPVQVTPQQA